MVLVAMVVPLGVDYVWFGKLVEAHADYGMSFEGSGSREAHTSFRV